MALVDYGGSSSSASENEDSPEINETPTLSSLKRPALPTAAALLGPKKPKPEEFVEDVVDDPALHGGRIRSFKHERGNWATYVYVPAAACADQLEEFQAEAIAHLKPHVELQANDSLHLSLSRTVVLQYHQIDEFSRSLQTALNSSVGFTATLQGLRIYTNEERTRTFIAAPLDPAFVEKMTAILQPIDQPALVPGRSRGSAKRETKRAAGAPRRSGHSANGCQRGALKMRQQGLYLQAKIGSGCGIILFEFNMIQDYF
ncbi:U6 snRNA phosphodiesterase 1 isoform X2 [Drosophila biarmipes]|uniref:U6 snRNA phosphodiesterase 1 isoform X2 n=1 Tax=Drosophila biarmipes TaxID=125945 RepID=UPI0021CCFE12|nr:U6 snRNA phosphodiesterase 1 isoform X2 [Drosophila biarmipes]